MRRPSPSQRSELEISYLLDKDSLGTDCGSGAEVGRVDSMIDATDNLGSEYSGHDKQGMASLLSECIPDALFTSHAVLCLKLWNTDVGVTSSQYRKQTRFK